jgi:hypothetical protein
MICCDSIGRFRRIGYNVVLVFAAMMMLAGCGGTKTPDEVKTGAVKTSEADEILKDVEENLDDTLKGLDDADGGDIDPSSLPGAKPKTEDKKQPTGDDAKVDANPASAITPPDNDKEGVPTKDSSADKGTSGDE